MALWREPSDLEVVGNGHKNNVSGIVSISKEFFRDSSVVYDSKGDQNIVKMNVSRIEAKTSTRNSRAQPDKFDGGM